MPVRTSTRRASPRGMRTRNLLRAARRGWPEENGLEKRGGKRAGTSERYPERTGPRAAVIAARATLTGARLSRRLGLPTGRRGRDVTRHPAQPPFDPLAAFEAGQVARDNRPRGGEARQPLAHRCKRQAHLFGDLRIESLTVFSEAMQDIGQCWQPRNGTAVCRTRVGGFQDGNCAAGDSAGFAPQTAQNSVPRASTSNESTVSASTPWIAEARSSGSRPSSLRP